MIEMQYFDKQDDTIEHPYSGWLYNRTTGEYLTQQIEFRDLNQMRCFYLGWRTALNGRIGPNAVPVDTVLRECVMQPSPWDRQHLIPPICVDA